METLIDSLEKQGNFACEKLALLQSEYEEFITNSRKVTNELEEQIKGCFSFIFYGKLMKFLRKRCRITEYFPEIELFDSPKAV